MVFCAGIGGSKGRENSLRKRKERLTWGPEALRAWGVLRSSQWVSVDPRNLRGEEPAREEEVMTGDRKVH